MNGPIDFPSFIQNIIDEKKESLGIEFKGYWYWSEKEEVSAKAWGEFLKDFSALFNTYNSKFEKKYFILGYDETNEKVNDYFIDKNGEIIKFLKNKDTLKKEIVEKIKSNFTSTPSFKNSNSLVELESFFEIKSEIINEHELLIIVFSNAPYLLEVKGILQGNESFREKNIIIRRLKNDLTPENSNASIDEINNLRSIVEKNYDRDLFEVDTSIKKIVELFVEKNIPMAIIKEEIIQHNCTTGIYYELYTIEGDYTSPRQDLNIFKGLEV
jgi:hypothetical protein